MNDVPEVPAPGMAEAGAETTEPKKSRPWKKPTPQRVYIRALMRRAIHPITKQRGITEDDIRALSVSSQLKAKSLLDYFDGITPSPDNKPPKPEDHGRYAFDHETGAAAPWADELAMLLGRDVRDVFIFEWAYMARRALGFKPPPGEKIDERLLYSRSDAIDGEVELGAAQEAHIASFAGENDTMMPTIDAERKAAVTQLLLRLRPREEYVIRRRFGINCAPATLEEIGDTFHVTRERIREIERKALGILKHVQRFHQRLPNADELDVPVKTIPGLPRYMPDRRYHSTVPGFKDPMTPQP